MRPPPFDYADPRTVDETIGLLAENGDEARVLAGGQSLLPLLNFRVAWPGFVIDINHVSELDFIRPREDGGLEIGALVRHRSVELSDLVRERCPLLHEAIQHVGHVQIRNRGTFGGSLAHADPGAELPTVVTTLDATLHLKSRRGDRTIKPADFYIGQLTTAIEPDELLVCVDIPGWGTRAGSAWCEFSRRQGDFALVGAGAALSFDGEGNVLRVGLALMNVGAVPFDAGSIAHEILQGKVADERNIDAVAKQVEAVVEPTADIHASAEYRKHLAGVMVRRALTEAAKRVSGGRGKH